MYSKELDFKYLSPTKLDIQEKKIKVKEKTKTVDELNEKYQELSRNMNKIFGRILRSAFAIIVKSEYQVG